MIEIRNCGGTSWRKSVTGIWQQDFYYYFAQSTDEPYQTNKVTYQCSAIGCCGMEIVGAHIRYPNKEKSGTHIIPLCRICNAKGTNHKMQISSSASSKTMPANRTAFEKRVRERKKEIEGRHRDGMKPFDDLKPKG